MKLSSDCEWAMKERNGVVEDNRRMCLFVGGWLFTLAVCVVVVLITVAFRRCVLNHQKGS